MDTANRIIALDIGGTHTRVALICSARTLPPNRTVYLVDSFPTSTEYDAEIERIVTVTRAARGQAEARGARIEGLGISIGGRMRADGSRLAVAPNLPGYVDRPLVSDLSERSGLPARAAHDTVCGLLGERGWGALASSERCAYLTMSTGLGAAIYLASWGQSTGLHVSIEMGHQILDGSARACLCGQIGCLETYVGGRQLELRHGAPLDSFHDATVWETLSDKLALGLVNLTQLTRVEVVAVGGGVALARTELLSELQVRVDARLRNARLRIVPAALGEHAPLVGAAALLTTDPGTILS
ncbi:MAG TPA: ROK family protein [Ktedonobacterales bacterium]